MPFKRLRVLLKSGAVLFLIFNVAYAAPANQHLRRFDVLWNDLVPRYSNGGTCMDFERWHSNPDDLKKLDDAVRFLEKEKSETDSENKIGLAELLNAYNTCIIQKVLKHYPMDSVNDVPKFFTQKDCKVSGSNFSLNDLENKARQKGGFRVLACLWGASKSSPPLKIQTFTKNSIESELNEQMKKWLSVKELNNFDCRNGNVFISKVFLWYEDDFGNDDERIKSILFQYGPDGGWREKLEKGSCGIEYMDFDQGISRACK